MFSDKFEYVLAAAEEQALTKAAIDVAQKGDVIVIDCGGCTRRAMVGGMMIACRQKKGIRGFAVDGAVRDIDDINSSSLAVYAKTVTPPGAVQERAGRDKCAGCMRRPGSYARGYNNRRQ